MRRRLTRPRRRGASRPPGGPAARRALRPLLPTLAALAALLAAAGPAAAQQVRFAPRADSEAQRELARFLERESYLLWTRDTVLAREDTVAGPVLVLEAAVRVAGHVTGGIYVVDGDLFLRPGARVAGDVLVLGGGLYRSGMATVEGEILYRPNEVLRVIPEEGGWLIFPVTEPPDPVDLGPLYGLRIPTYQRVDAWTFGWGGTFRVPSVAWQPELRVELRYKTEHQNLEGTVRQFWHPSGGFRFGVQASRATRSNDAWIRSGFVNSLSFLFVGNDYRDYHRADRVGLVFELDRPDGWTFTLSPRWEEARSLEARPQEIFFQPDSVRPNPPVDPGDAWSLTGALQYARRSGDSRTRVHLSLEAASRDVGGDFSFVMGQLQLQLRRPVALGHAVELFAIGRGDLGGTLPGQRRSALGGIGTLPTFSILSLRGERMFLGELGYAVPIPVLDVPVVGPTEVFVRGAAGSAWSEGEEIRVAENLMAGLRFLALETAVALDPGSGDVQVYLTGRFPRELRGPAR